MAPNLRRGFNALADCLNPFRHNHHHKSKQPQSPIRRDVTEQDPFHASNAEYGEVVHWYEADARDEPVTVEVGAMDDDTLYNHCGSCRARLDSLREMNRRLDIAILALFDGPGSAEERKQEAESLILEAARRREEIGALEWQIEPVRAELRRRGLALCRPASCCTLNEPDDPTLCQFCITYVADAEFLCCHYTGACCRCASALISTSNVCPHCRAVSPRVQTAAQVVGLEIPSPGVAS
eukprot:GGOE01013775.1.p1 GENE.GGOE01013775.1~~GGOE01013775.1.p1  ORF type:complete len:254 (+),score=57.00 GGOE01013775.1:50-763(+)